MVGFARLLRRYGSAVGPAETQDALQALDRINLDNGETFRLSLRTVLAKNTHEQEIFDRCFSLYWHVWDRAHELNRGQAEQGKGHATPAAKPKPKESPRMAVRDWLKQGEPADQQQEAAGYSPFEVTTKRDFSTFSADQLQEVARLIDAIARVLAARFNRRYRHSKRKGRLDLRRTLRANLRRGGEMLDLAHRQRRRQRLKLVLLCDVSKSMDLYSRFLLQFLYAFQRAYRRIETFVFSTSLHRVTATLQDGDINAALDHLAEQVPDWSGGTKIGASLDEFLTDYGTALVDRHTVVLIVSDGWDTGDTELLEDSMRRLHQRARCLVWLNPLMGSDAYQPTCRGMQVALPYIDLFAPAHNLDSLRDLVRHLGKIQRGAFAARAQPTPKKADAQTAPTKSNASLSKKSNGPAGSSFLSSKLRPKG